MSVCFECCVLSGRVLCDELITRPGESYRLCCVVGCDLETSRMGALYIYDISNLRVKCLLPPGTTQLQLINISYIISYHILYHIILYHIIYRIYHIMYRIYIIYIYIYDIYIILSTASPVGETSA